MMSPQYVTAAPPQPAYDPFASAIVASPEPPPRGDLSVGEAQFAIIAALLVSLAGAALAAGLYRVVLGSWSGKDAKRRRVWAAYGVGLGAVSPATKLIDGLALSDTNAVALGALGLLILPLAGGVIGGAAGALFNRRGETRGVTRRSVPLSLGTATRGRPIGMQDADRVRPDDALDGPHAVSAKPALARIVGFAIARPWLALALVVALGALWLARYDLQRTNAPGVIYRLDRWTGHITTCVQSSCQKLQ